MLRRSFKFSLPLVAAVLLLSGARARAAVAGDEAPVWLKQAAAAQAPAYAKDVPAVVLHDESTLTVAPDGRTTTVTTYAVRILTREGRTFADATEFYDSDSEGKVRELRAWLIRPDGSVKKFGKDEAVDAAASLEDVYNETRRRTISAEDEAVIGSVFGYTSVTEARPFFPQAVWNFQGRLPSLASRFTLNVPAGWRASGVTLNAAKLDPAVSGASYTWEMRNLPPIDPEPSSPSVSALAPRVAVSYSPASAPPPTGRSFDTWADVSGWYSDLSDPQSAPDEAIAAKARELTAGAKTELEKIQAVGRYVQDIQYISIQIGIGGYRPHAASQVFAKKYGDCKDKANLMRAMLRALGMDSYLVLIYLGDRSFVREEWASPTQFNHCIIAVKVGAETEAASVVQHPKLGRLLVFDATDESTPVGDLPDDEQGSFALLAAGPEGALMRMPVTRPEDNLWKREVEVGLAADGSITAAVRERLLGQSAVAARRLFKGLAKADFVKAVERRVSGGATGARFTKIEPEDNHAGGRFALDIEFAAAQFGQTMQDRLLVFKPAVVSRGQSVSLAEPTRKHPLLLESEAFTETVRVRLPAGFEVDEVPDAVKLNSEFCTYTATYEIKEGQLVYTRTLVQRAATIPAEKYKEVRDFFGRVRASEEAPVVLARK